MAISIPDDLTIQPVSTASPIAEQSAAAPTSSAVSPSTVDVSEETRVHMLQQQGESPAEIANILGISVSVVDGYLGIAVPAVATSPAPAQPTGTTPKVP